jgi:protein-L-isoaspartate(D-aspartate) O-methyltransferase
MSRTSSAAPARSARERPSSLSAALAALLVCLPAPGGGTDDQARRRERMVRDQIEARGVSNPLVLRALRAVRRELFLPEALRRRAYEDGALPIGHDQTISQPYIVAAMTEAALLRGGERVLEIGTGSGYQAAVLARIAAEVYSIEIVADLGRAAQRRLAALGYKNVQVRIGDGYLGWPEAAPFDAILVTAAPETIPEKLVAQLKPGGRMVLPVGAQDEQELFRVTRTATGTKREKLLDVNFVPMVRGK